MPVAGQTGGLRKPITCNLCQTLNHTVKDCPKLKPLTLMSREQLVIDSKICINCFSARHMLEGCKEKNFCRSCEGRLHTVLHGLEKYASDPKSEGAAYANED